MSYESAASRRIARMRGHGDDRSTGRLVPFLSIWLALYAVAVAGGLRELNANGSAQSIASAASAPHPIH